MSKVEIADAVDVQVEVRQGNIERKALGVLIKHYPTRDWYVDANLEGMVLEIRCTSISMKYGMVVHLHYNQHEMDRRVYAAASELLERFRLSRDKSVTGDESNLTRRIDGEVVGAAKGEA